MNDISFREDWEVVYVKPETSLYVGIARNWFSELLKPSHVDWLKQIVQI